MKAALHLNQYSGSETAGLSILTCPLFSPKTQVLPCLLLLDFLYPSLAAVFSTGAPWIASEDGILDLPRVEVALMSTGFAEVEEVVMRYRRLQMHMMTVGALIQRLDWNKIDEELLESHEVERLSCQNHWGKSSRSRIFVLISMDRGLY